MPHRRLPARADDPRVVGTVEAIAARAAAATASSRATAPDEDGAVDGLPGGEGAFLPCSFWLADDLALIGRARRGARRCSSGCSALRNDVGLLAEEYDPRPGGMLGNFPQAFTHLAVITTAHRLSGLPAPKGHAPAAPA